jgi:N-acetylmuramic acid 6-phosphate etherase
MVRMGKVFGNLMVDLQVTCDKLQDRGERILVEMTEVSRADAKVLLERAHGSVKVALVMGKLGISREDAIQRLDEVNGVVARVMGEGE